MITSCESADDLKESTVAPSAVDNGLDCIAQWCIIVSGILLVFLVASFGWLVFGRYVLNDTPTWVEQSSLLIVVYGRWRAHQVPSQYRVRAGGVAGNSTTGDASCC